MIYYFDVDNTVCKTKEGDYPNAVPYKRRIQKINKLGSEGHKIVMVTARGALSGLRWLEFTKDQLDKWGLKYHELHSKPYYDVLVDDKAFSDKEFFK
jgi:hypothetical protein